MNAVMPRWHFSLRLARDRGNRIESEMTEQVMAFDERKSRVERATEQAEKAAVTLMIRSDDLARAVARRHR